MDALQQALLVIEELEEDSALPKHIRSALVSTKNVLSQDVEQSIKVSKALQELESLAEDGKIQSDVRMQIFNIVSLLETS